MPYEDDSPPRALFLRHVSFQYIAREPIGIVDAENESGDIEVVTTW